MAYIVSSTDLTSVANAIRTAGETSEPLEFPSGFVTAIGNISGGGGGATNVVSGKFTAASSEAGTAKTINLSYSGSGYPIAAIVYPSAGAWKSGESIYTVVQQKVVVTFALAKSDISLAPDYGTSDTTKNHATAFGMFKNSASDATSTSYTGAKTAICYTSYAANGGHLSTILRFNSATAMSIFVAEANYNGFLPDTEYEYQIIYSA